MADAPLALSCSGPIARIEFRRPERRNALDLATWIRLPQLVSLALARAETRVLAVTGTGGDFAAGADISEFDEVFASRETTLHYLDLMARATHSLRESPIPVVACIEGLCIGAGVSIAMACDVRLAATNAEFALTPAKLGLAYSLADTYRLATVIGRAAASDLLFTGRRIDAATALRIGLVNQTFDPARFTEEVQGYLAAIGAVSDWSNRRSKAVLALIEQGVTEDTGETRTWFADGPRGADFREGLSAFRERRTPRFPR